MTKIASVALILVASVLAMDATAEPTVSSTSNSIRGIEIAGSGSIPENIAAKLRSSSAGDLSPYAIVVRNTGSLPVTGLVIRYEISVNGKADLLVLSYLSHGHSQPGLALPMVAPGGSIIIVPFPDLTIVNFHTLSEKGQPTIPNPGWALRGPDVNPVGGIEAHTVRFLNSMEFHTARFLNSADRVTIEVDSVIRSDGTIVGPDRSLQFDLFQREISEYTEFRNHLLQLFAERATVADINAWLQQIAHQQVVRQPNEAPPDRSPVKLTAQKYLQYIQNQGLQYAWDKLKAATPEEEFGWFYKLHQGVNQ